MNEKENIINIPEQLIPEPYNYENIMENPIVKPIAETDKRVSDIDEIISKRLANAVDDKKWINDVLQQEPSYSDSVFVGKLLRMWEDTQEVIKLYWLEINCLKECIKEIHIIVTEKYGKKVDSKISAGDTVKIKAHNVIIPEGSEKNYLIKLTNHNNAEIQNIAKEYLKIFESENEENENKKFRIAGGRCYSAFTDKAQKDIVAKILRMQL